MAAKLNTTYTYSNGEIHLHLQNYLKERIDGLTFDIGDKQIESIISSDLEMSVAAALVLSDGDDGLVPATHIDADQTITFSLCHIVEQEGWACRDHHDPIGHDFRAAIEIVQRWNSRHKREEAKQIRQHRFYAPYQLAHDHWSTALLEVTFAVEKITQAKLIIIEPYYRGEMLRAKITAMVAGIKKAKLLPRKVKLAVECIANQQQQNSVSSGVVTWLTIRDAITHGMAYIRSNTERYSDNLAEQRRIDIEKAFEHDSSLAAKIIMLQSSDTVYSRIAAQGDEITVNQVVGMDEEFVKFVEQNVAYNDLASFNLTADELLEEEIVDEPENSSEMREMKRLLCQAQAYRQTDTKPLFWPYLFHHEAGRIDYINQSGAVNLIWLLISWKLHWLASQQPWPLPKGWAIDKEIMRQREVSQERRRKRAAAKKAQADKARQEMEREKTMQDIASALSSPRAVLSSITVEPTPEPNPKKAQQPRRVKNIANKPSAVADEAQAINQFLAELLIAIQDYFKTVKGKALTQQKAYFGLDEGAEKIRGKAARELIVYIDYQNRLQQDERQVSQDEQQFWRRYLRKYPQTQILVKVAQAQGDYITNLTNFKQTVDYVIHSVYGDDISLAVTKDSIPSAPKPVATPAPELVELKPVVSLSDNADLFQFFVELVQAIDVDLLERAEKKPNNDYNDRLKAAFFIERDNEQVYLDIKNLLLLTDCFNSEAFLSSLITDPEYLHWPEKWPIYSLVDKTKQRVENGEIALTLSPERLTAAKEFLQQITQAGERSLMVTVALASSEQIALAERKIIQGLLGGLSEGNSPVEAMRLCRDMVARGAVFALVNKLPNGTDLIVEKESCQGVIYFEAPAEPQSSCWPCLFIDETRVNKVVKSGVIDLASEEELRQYLLGIAAQIVEESSQPQKSLSALSPQQRYAQQYSNFRKLAYLVERYYYQQPEQRREFDDNGEVSQEFFEKYRLVIEEIVVEDSLLRNTRAMRKRLQQCLASANDGYQFCQQLNAFFTQQGNKRIKLPSQEAYTEFGAFLNRDECLVEYNHFVTLATLVEKEKNRSDFTQQDAVSDTFYANFHWQLLDDSEEDASEERKLLQQMLVEASSVNEFCQKINGILDASEAITIPNAEETAQLLQQEDNSDAPAVVDEVADQTEPLAMITLPREKVVAISAQIGYDQVLQMVSLPRDGQLFQTFDIVTNIMMSENAALLSLKERVGNLLTLTPLTDEKALSEFTTAVSSELLQWLNSFPECEPVLHTVEETLPLLEQSAIVMFWFLTSIGRTHRKNISVEIENFQQAQEGDINQLAKMVAQAISFARTAANQYFSGQLSVAEVTMQKIKRALYQFYQQHGAQQILAAETVEHGFVKLFGAFDQPQHMAVYVFTADDSEGPEEHIGLSAEAMVIINRTFAALLAQDDGNVMTMFDTSDPVVCTAVYNQYKKWQRAVADYSSKNDDHIALIRVDYYGCYFMFANLIDLENRDENFIRDRARLAPVLAAIIVVSLDKTISAEDKQAYLQEYAKAFNHLVATADDPQLLNYQRILMSIDVGRIKPAILELQQKLSGKLSTAAKQQLQMQQVSTVDSMVAKQLPVDDDIDETYGHLAESDADRVEMGLVALEQESDAIRQWLQNDNLGMVYADTIVEITNAIRHGEDDEVVLMDCIMLQELIEWSMKQHTLPETDAEKLLTVHRDIHDAVMRDATAIAYSRSINSEVAAATIEEGEQRESLISAMYRTLTDSADHYDQTLREPPITLQEQIENTLTE